MSVFDPSLDRTSTWPSLRDEREVAMLRHDIRGALAGVIEGVRRIGRARLDAELKPEVERIVASAEALEWLITQAFAEGGPNELAAEADVDRLIAHLRQRFAAAARDAGTSFRVEMDPGLPSRLSLDPLSLVRAVENLLAGALEDAQGGAVTLSASAEAGDIVFRVSGERPGGAPAARAPGLATGSRALGEQIARTLADRLGGRIDLGDAGDGRSAAVLRLPGSVAAAAARTPAADACLAGVRILLAEDNPTNQMVAATMLKTLEAEVLVCSDGVEALERFDGFPADLVVVDIEMPRLTGLDVIRAIRSRGDAKAHVPIVALTAYAMREHRERIAAAGANGLIPKPITGIEALGQALAAHVRPAARTPAAPVAEGLADGSVLPVMDTAVFDELCRTIGPDLVGELMDKVVADLLDARNRLDGAFAPFDRLEIERTAHILISVAGAFGAARLQARARALNNDCRKAAVPREAIEPQARLCIAEIDAAVGFARSRAGGV